MVISQGAVLLWNRVVGKGVINGVLYMDSTRNAPIDYQHLSRSGYHYSTFIAKGGQTASV